MLRTALRATDFCRAAVSCRITGAASIDFWQSTNPLHVPHFTIRHSPTRKGLRYGRRFASRVLAAVAGSLVTHSHRLAARRFAFPLVLFSSSTSPQRSASVLERFWSLQGHPSGHFRPALCRCVRPLRFRFFPDPYILPGVFFESNDLLTQRYPVSHRPLIVFRKKNRFPIFRIQHSSIRSLLSAPGKSRTLSSSNQWATSRISPPLPAGMVVKEDGTKWACSSCLKGHRVSGCTHTGLSFPPELLVSLALGRRLR